MIFGFIFGVKDTNPNIKLISGHTIIWLIEWLRRTAANEYVRGEMLNTDQPSVVALTRPLSAKQYFRSLRCSHQRPAVLFQINGGILVDGGGG